jgi:hypothetical protein
MEIVKQLFDIGKLFDYCADTKTLIASYTATQAQESEYGKPKHSKEDALDDSIQTAFLVSQYLLKGYKSSDEIKEIATGLKQIENHLLGVLFKIDQARIAAAKYRNVTMRWWTTSSETPISISHSFGPTSCSDGNTDPVRNCFWSGRRIARNI